MSMYTHVNFKTKKALKQAVDAWNDRQGTSLIAGVASSTARPVTYYQPGPFGGNEPQNGTIYAKGPHYPEPHRWYAQCVAKDGAIVKVK
jgi:hypothetical protein